MKTPQAEDSSESRGPFDMRKILGTNGISQNFPVFWLIKLLGISKRGVTKKWAQNMLGITKGVF